MPPPPPYGSSSTVRWRSCAKSRRSRTATSSRPFSIARPTSEVAQEGLEQLGKDGQDLDAHASISPSGRRQSIARAAQVDARPGSSRRTAAAPAARPRAPRPRASRRRPSTISTTAPRSPRALVDRQRQPTSSNCVVRARRRRRHLPSGRPRARAPRSASAASRSAIPSKAITSSRCGVRARPRAHADRGAAPPSAPSHGARRRRAKRPGNVGQRLDQRPRPARRAAAGSGRPRSVREVRRAGRQSSRSSSSSSRPSRSPRTRRARAGRRPSGRGVRSPCRDRSRRPRLAARRRSLGRRPPRASSAHGVRLVDQQADDRDAGRRPRCSVGLSASAGGAGDELLDGVATAARRSSPSSRRAPCRS